MDRERSGNMAWIWMGQRSEKVAEWNGGADMDQRAEWEGGGVPVEFV